ncbi:hypothetical protein nvc1_036 [Namao virus]|nr:hypothetical protein nvc1_036 [Namao virus]
MKTSRYTLINPVVHGNIIQTIRSPNSLIAAKEIYSDLSNKFSTRVNQFYFTLYKGPVSELKTDNFYHFVAQETEGGDGSIHYKINKLEIMPDMEALLTERINQTFNIVSAKKGGDDISEKYMVQIEHDYPPYRFIPQSANLYVVFTNPLQNAMWYNPHIYALSRIFVPSFSIPVHIVYDMNVKLKSSPMMSVSTE